MVPDLTGLGGDLRKKTSKSSEFEVRSGRDLGSGMAQKRPSPVLARSAKKKSVSKTNFSMWKLYAITEATLPLSNVMNQ